MPTKRRARQYVREPGDLHTLESFCEANQLSLSLFYKLRKAGEGPRVIKAGRRIMISPEAEAEWRREREAKAHAAGVR